MNRQHRTIQTGFTLIEFMIASILGLIVIAAVGSLYIYTAKLNEIAVQRVNVQQDLRNASTIISRDARVAGNFGCLNIGSVYDEDSYSTMKSNFQVRYSVGSADKLGSDAIDRPGGSKRTGEPEVLAANRSFGVRTLEANQFNIPGFTASGKVLLFYYGLGSSASVKTVDVGDLTTPANRPAFRDSDPNQTISNVVTANSGHLAISSCSALYVFRGAGATRQNDGRITIDLFDGANNTLELKVSNDKEANDFQPNTISLFRYMVSAYAVGTVDGKTALYRFEIGEDGEWQGPELLADNVSQMDVNFVYATTGTNTSSYDGCPTAFGDGTKANTDFSKDANQYGIVKSEQFTLQGKGKWISPAAVELNLTYAYPTVNNEAIGTEGDQTYHIYAAIRGGNACANRILSN